MKSRRIVGVSGGVDSMSLLAVTAEYYGSDSVDAVYLDHGVRSPEEVANDVAVISTFCRTRDIRFSVRRVPVRAYADKFGNGLEASGRHWRYRVLTHLAKLRSACCVFTAHHRSDSAETIIFKLIRGTGIGVSPILRTWMCNGVLVVRPFLNVSKDDIWRYSQRHNIPFSEDSTNNELLFSRNRIRHDVLPKLVGINSNAEKHIVDFAQRTSEMVDYVKSQAPYQLVHQIGFNYELSSQIQVYHSVLQDVVYVALLQQLSVDPSAVWVQRLRKLMAGSRGKVQLSKQWYVIRVHHGLRFTPTS